MMQYTAEQIAAYKKRKKLEMTKRRFFYCVGRRVNYDWRPMVAYLDVQTGKILYVFRESTHATVDGSESAEDNEAKKVSSPRTYRGFGSCQCLLRKNTPTS